MVTSVPKLKLGDWGDFEWCTKPGFVWKRSGPSSRLFVKRIGFENYCPESVAARLHQNEDLCYGSMIWHDVNHFESVVHSRASHFDWLLLQDLGLSPSSLNPLIWDPVEDLLCEEPNLLGITIVLYLKTVQALNDACYAGSAPLVWMAGHDWWKWDQTRQTDRCFNRPFIFCLSRSFSHDGVYQNYDENWSSRIRIIVPVWLYGTCMRIMVPFYFSTR